MKYCSVKNCVNNVVSGSEIFHNIRKECKEQVIWKTKHPIFICSEHFDNSCYRNKDSKILKNGAVPSIFKMGCVNNSLQVARHDHTYQRENLSKEQLFERLQQSSLKAKEFQQKLHLSEKKKRKLEEKVERLEETITNLKEKFSIPDETLIILQSAASKVPEQLFNRTVKKIKFSETEPGTSYERTYHPALRSFALTLHLFSAQAYR